MIIRRRAWSSSSPCSSRLDWRCCRCFWAGYWVIRPCGTSSGACQDALWGVVATIPLIALFLAILKWPIGPLARAKHFCENEVEPLLHDSSWSEIGLISLSVGSQRGNAIPRRLPGSSHQLARPTRGIGDSERFVWSAPSHLSAVHGDGWVSRALSRRRMDFERKPADCHCRSRALRFRRSIVSHSHSASPACRIRLDLVVNGAGIRPARTTRDDFAGRSRYAHEDGSGPH